MSKRGDKRRKGNSKPRAGKRVRGRKPFVGELSTELHDDPQKTLREILSTIPVMAGSSPPEIRDGSRMAADRDTAPNLVCLPHLCQNYISGANDFLLTLHRLLLTKSGRVEIPRYSAYPLIRGVIEHAGQACWILGATNRRERFVRLLQVQKSEMTYDAKYVAATSSSEHLRADDTPEVRSKANEIQREAKAVQDRRMATLLQVAGPLGIDKSEFERGILGGYESIVATASREAHLMEGHTENESHWIGRYAASVWTFISGLTHPSTSRAWANAEGDKPGGELEVIETASNPVLIRDSLLLGLRLQAHAFTLWQQACTPP